MFFVVFAAGLVFSTGALLLLDVFHDHGYLDRGRWFCYALAFLGGTLIGFAPVVLLKG